MLHQPVWMYNLATWYKSLCKIVDLNYLAWTGVYSLRYVRKLPVSLHRPKHQSDLVQWLMVLLWKYVYIHTFMCMCILPGLWVFVAVGSGWKLLALNPTKRATNLPWIHCMTNVHLRRYHNNAWSLVIVVIEIFVSGQPLKPLLCNGVGLTQGYNIQIYFVSGWLAGSLRRKLFILTDWAGEVIEVWLTHLCAMMWFDEVDIHKTVTDTTW